MIDNHGYVVISKDERETGRFFGEIDWLVMDSLIHYGVFRRCVSEHLCGNVTSASRADVDFSFGY